MRKCFHLVDAAAVAICPASQRADMRKPASDMLSEMLLPTIVLLASLRFAVCQNPDDCCPVPEKPPHIVLILSDDVGWDDFSLHGSNQIPTPNVDALLANGVILRRYYSAPMCTPARSSLMTGKYASRVGMQHYVIPNDQPYGLSLEHKLMPEYLRELGYRTCHVGKWHLGFFEERYTAIHRGFDSSFGYNGGMIDFYKHESDSIGNPWHFLKGYDMRRNGTLAYDTRGRYATDLFTDEAVRTIRDHAAAGGDQPMFLYLAQLAAHAGNEDLSNQAPQDVIEKFGYIVDEKRRAYAAVMSKLDESVGRVVAALRETGMLDNCVVVFINDNGAPVKGELANYGSNYPHRGQKDSPWEGGSHVIGGIWSSHLQARQRVSTELFHITDWLPTFVHLAGGQINDPTIDGINQWPSLCRDAPSDRKELLVNIDQASPYRSFIWGDWKLVNGSALKGVYDAWLSETNDRTQINAALAADYGNTITGSCVNGILADYCDAATSPPLTAWKAQQLRSKTTITCNDVPHTKCDTQTGPCLFNIAQDPCERFNLAKVYPELVEMLGERVRAYDAVAEVPRNRPDDRRSDPRYFNETWTWWFDELGLDRDSNALTELFQLQTVDVGTDANAALKSLESGLFQNFNNALDTVSDAALEESEF